MQYHKPHTVYLAWRGNNPLYVGMTYRLHERLNDHRTKKAVWWPVWDGIDLFEVPNWHAAQMLESALIADLSPLFNQTSR